MNNIIDLAIFYDLKDVVEKQKQKQKQLIKIEKEKQSLKDCETMKKELKHIINEMYFDE
jgi:hypothetical protein